MLIPRFGEAIESEVVFFSIYFFQEPPAKLFELHFVYLAFKNRLLYPLTIILADLGNAAQPSPARFCFSANIIGDNNPHGIS